MTTLATAIFNEYMDTTTGQSLPRLGSMHKDGREHCERFARVAEAWYAEQGEESEVVWVEVNCDDTMAVLVDLPVGTRVRITPLPPHGEGEK